MKILIQWSYANSEDWEEVDSSDWPNLVSKYKKALPILGRGNETLDQIRGWICNINVQGVLFGEADHYAVEDLNDGEGGIRVTSWHDDPDDFSSDLFFATSLTFKSLAPDDFHGGSYNTRQIKTVYCTGENKVEQEANPSMTACREVTMINEWSTFTAPPEDLTIHGVWMPDSLYDDHDIARSSRGWGEWTDGVPEDFLFVDENGIKRLKAGRSMGLYNKPKGTFTYFPNNTSQPAGSHTATHELATGARDVDPGTGGATQINGGNLGDGADTLDFLFASPSSEPGEATWPTGNYRCQIDIVAIGVNVSCGFRAAGSSNGHLARVNSDLSADQTTNPQTEILFTATGNNLGSTGSVSMGSASSTDRFEALCATVRAMTGGHGNQRVDINVITSNTFMDGPWTSGLSIVKVIDEVENVNEDKNKTKVISKAIDETVDVVEGIVKSMELVRIRDEVENINEGIVKTKLITKVIDEVENIVEGIDKAVGQVKIIDETVNIVEGIEKTKLITKIIDEIENIQAPGGGGSQTLDLQIGADADDIRHFVSGSHGVAQVILNIGESLGFTQDSAMRFTGVSIPAGATIDVAHLIFTPDLTESGTDVLTNIQAHAADNSPQVVTDTNWHDIVDANLTAAQVVWDNIGTWTNDVEEQSPSIVPIVQEALDNGYLNSGIFHVFVLNDGSSGGAFRRSHQHEDDNTKAVKLHIEFTTAGGGFEAIAVLQLNRILNEVMNINEGIVPTQVLLRILNEQESINEEIIKTKLIAKSINEAENVVEGIEKVLGQVKVIDETVDINEGIVKSQLIVKILSEIVNIQGGGSQTLDLQVGANSDDIDRPPFSLTFSNLLFDNPTSGQEGAARFTGVTIPQGATINVAHVIATPSATDATGSPGTTITGEDADDPGTFTDDTDFLARSRTGTSVPWSLPAFTIDVEVQSPSLIAIVQAVVNRGGFAGDGMVFFFRADENTDRRSFSHDNDSSKALKLHVEFISGIEALAVLALNRILNEVVNINEDIVKSQILVKILNEQERINEVIVKTKLISKSIDETININEGVERVLGQVKIIDEVVNINEETNKTKGISKSIDETVNIDEVVVRVRDIIKIVNETENIQEGLLIARVLVRLINEIENINEVTVRALALVRILNETENVVEDIQKVLGQVKVIDEVVNINEVTNRAIEIFKIIDETVDINEAIVKTQILVRILSETENIVEGLLTVQTLNRIINEIESIEENITKSMALIKIIDETINIVEGIVTFIIAPLIGFMRATFKVFGSVSSELNVFSSIASKIKLRGKHD